MPYIAPQDRPMFDTMIDGLVKQCRARKYDRNGMAKVVANILTYGLTRAAYAYEITQTIDGIIKDLAKRIRVRGDANYIVCRVVLESMKPEKGWSYHSLSDAVAAVGEASEYVSFVAEELGLLSPFTPKEFNDCLSVIEDVQYEIHRRLLDPYEDTAILKNGDMACFANEDFCLMPLGLDLSGLAGLIPQSGCGGNCKCKTDFSDVACGGQGLEDLPPITEAFTQQQVDAVDEERRADEG